MAVRNFPAVGVIRFAQAVDLTGAFSIFAVVKRNSTTGYHGVFTVENAAGSTLQWALEVANGAGNLVDGSTNTLSSTATGVTASSTDGWVIVGITKTAGSTIPVLHVFKAGAWTRGNATQGTRPNQATVTGGRLSIGQWKGTDQLDGRVAAVFVWQGLALSTAQVNTMNGMTRAQIVDLGGVGALTWGVVLDQAATTDPAVPIGSAAASGAQSSSSGTAVVTGDDPASTVFNMSTGLSVVGGSLVQPAGVQAFRAASLVQPAVVRTVVGGSLVQGASINQTLTTVGASLAQPAQVIGQRGASLAQPATVRAFLGGSLVQSASVGQVIVGASLVQRANVYRTLVRVGAGNNDASARAIVRTRAGRVYIFAQETGQPSGGTAPSLLAYKSDQTGKAITSFTEVNHAGRPTTTARLTAPDCVFDPASGLVHLTYVDNAAGQASSVVYYQTFDTATDTWGSREQVATGAFGPPNTTYPFGRACSGIALDIAGTIHVAYASSTSVVSHKTRTGPGTWSSAASVATGQTQPVHHQLAVDYAGDLHLAWFSQGTPLAMRYAKRPVATGTWAAAETVADATAQAGEGGLSDAANLDQCGSIVVNTANEPVVIYLSAIGAGGADDNTGDFVRVRRRTGGTWVSDHPTRTSFSGVHAHTPSIYAQGDTLYALLAHGDAPNLWPGMAKKEAGAWTGGPTGQVTIPAGSSSIGATVLFDGSAYISGTRTSTGSVGSAGSTLDGSASPRYDPQHEVDATVADVCFWDENFNGAGTNNGMLYYAAIPTGLTAVGASLAQPATVATASLITVGASLVTPATVRSTVGASLAQPATMRTVVAGSLQQPATVRTVVGGSLAQPAVTRTVLGASLAQPATVRALVGASLTQPATVRVTTGASLVQSGQILNAGIVGASLAQPAVLRTFRGGSLVQPAGVLTIRGGSLVQGAAVGAAISTVGASLLAVATVRRLAGGSLVQPAGMIGAAGASLRMLAAIRGSGDFSYTPGITDAFTYQLDDAPGFTYGPDDAAGFTYTLDGSTP